VTPRETTSVPIASQSTGIVNTIIDGVTWCTGAS
jgi:hypothetical protein